MSLRVISTVSAVFAASLIFGYPSSAFNADPLTLPNLNVSSTSDASSYNVTSPENAVSLEITCSGEYFGYGPSIADCESAKSYITPDSTQHTWGERHTGLPDTTFPLPFRVMGGKFSIKDLSDCLNNWNR